jgi:tRNA (Thr-GGU) A37 N-methylase
MGVDPQNHRLEISYTDAEDGTPVLDIKPYHPSEDRVRDVRMPDWCAHWPEYWEESGDFDWSGEFSFHE